MAGYRPVNCAELHVAETFHVGAAAGRAGRARPPGRRRSGPRTRSARSEADDFLGGPWRGARIVVRAVFPSREGWAGGARWFRCDVAQASLDGSSDTSRTGSLAGALAGASALRLGCFNATVNADAVRTMIPVACTKPHAAEFAGLWTAPDIPYAEQVRDRVRSAAGCRRAIARFTGVPDDDDVQFRTGWISYNPTRGEWQQGERRVRCFLWFSDRTLTRSLAGAGPSALPVG